MHRSTHTQSTRNQSRKSQALPDELNRTAEELNQLARTFLPDDVLGGLLRDREQEIRQDAILLALGWRFRDPEKTETSNCQPWFAPRALAAALKFTKRRYITTLSAEDERNTTFDEKHLGATLHHFSLECHEWPEGEVVEIIREAIATIVRAGKLNPANGMIATRIFVDHESVKEVAASHRVNRSAIYQRLVRIKAELSSIVDTIELPYCG